ncbi:MAG: HAD-IA family hydrolase, partial [Candidatus Margulisbacteria bacterium]|nr:HAD-IA family hydrolase [Candidatus Margulisiibacteriota bacterium]
VAGSIGTTDKSKVTEAQGEYYRIHAEKLKDIPLYPHVKETIEHFKNKKLAIISNKRDEFIRKILKQHGLGHRFADILGGDTANCLKPDPCAVKLIMQKHDIPPDRTLIVGDMTVDVETGKNAGVRTCAVTYGFDNRAKLEQARPDLLIDDFQELTNLIQ